MPTKHVEYLLPDYLNSRLDEALRPGVETHLAGCAACRSELEALRETFQALTEHHLEQPPAGYFSTVLPRIRERLEKKEQRSFLAHPLLVRLALPLATGALVLLLVLHFPFTASDSEAERNPLRPVLQGLPTEDLVDIVLDQTQHQAFNTFSEGETSSMLAAPLLRGDYIPAITGNLPQMEGPILGGSITDSLDQLSETEVEALVARLGERTIL